jgi:pimeloyl-ACP methyl ester carboxylesterase
MGRMREWPEPPIVLVHGLWMRGWVMALLGLRLQRAGFRVLRFTYSSMRATLSQNAASLAQFITAFPGAHVVGHSLGGLVILQMLSDYPELPVGRVVLLGTPAHDCAAARALGQRKWSRRILGKSLPQWYSRARRGGSYTPEIGVIAGSLPIGLGRLVGQIARPNDGVVSVSETRLPGTKAQAMLPVSHTQMLLSSAVANEVAEFLRAGHFSAER